MDLNLCCTIKHCDVQGLWQKQSSLWFQAVSAQTQLQDNIFYNGPRAAFNFNVSITRHNMTRYASWSAEFLLCYVYVVMPFLVKDGFGGGDDISGNLLLNCVRESSDHGPCTKFVHPFRVLCVYASSSCCHCALSAKFIWVPYYSTHLELG